MAEFDEYEASQSFFEDEEQECFDGERPLRDGKQSARLLRNNYLISTLLTSVRKGNCKRNGETF